MCCVFSDGVIVCCAFTDFSDGVMCLVTELLYIVILVTR